MAGERGSALAAALVMIVAMATMAQAAVVTWGIPPNPGSLTVSQSEPVTFNFVANQHDLVAVNEQQYNQCDAGSSPTKIPPKTAVTLKKGKNYFICTIGQHCIKGMKITITAT
ncbi:basic blue protein [Striga asiatica]|uniref:Basic blue protein n=1 Tax=Striga asiatica TaxID=4170 RepID=A0A5A7NW10_STRAF|nr:basic blue protein [Striga asiatica]